MCSEPFSKPPNLYSNSSTSSIFFWKYWYMAGWSFLSNSSAWCGFSLYFNSFSSSLSCLFSSFILTTMAQTSSSDFIFSFVLLIASLSLANDEVCLDISDTAARSVSMWDPETEVLKIGNRGVKLVLLLFWGFTLAIGSEYWLTLLNFPSLIFFSPLETSANLLSYCSIRCCLSLQLISFSFSSSNSNYWLLSLKSLSSALCFSNLSSSKTFFFCNVSVNSTRELIFYIDCL